MRARIRRHIVVSQFKQELSDSRRNDETDRILTQGFDLETERRLADAREEGESNFPLQVS